MVVRVLFGVNDLFLVIVVCWYVGVMFCCKVGDRLCFFSWVGWWFRVGVLGWGVDVVEE